MQNTNRIDSGKEGAILGIVLVMMVTVTLVILSLYHLGAHSGRETDYELKSAQAFWLAEAGREWCVQQLYAGNDGATVVNTAISASVPGTFAVEIDPADSSYRISTGTITVAGQVVVRRIRFGVAFIAKPFEKAIYAGNDNSSDWSFQLSGTGGYTPPASGSGGADSVLGDLDINGNVLMQGASKVDLPTPNNYSLSGDVDATGTITKDTTASISGTARSLVFSDPVPDLTVMDYANNNNYDIAKIFNDAGVTSGYLPVGHALRDVVVKNPTDRATENGTTVGDDYYFEPSRVSTAGTTTTGVTPLNLGDDKSYYVDGHVWFHSKRTYGFQVNGQAAIVSTRDIHVSDNLSYADRSISGDLLALVALGQYSEGVLESGGNVYFGDPEFGTLYTADAFMFANNNFYYNTKSNTGEQREPTSGFQVFGNFMAVNQVKVQRDWYTKAGSPRAAEYDAVNNVWIDAADARLGIRTELLSDEILTLRHYAMKIGYDDRIRDAATQMSGLPRGGSDIFAGVKSWEEILAE